MCKWNNGGVTVQLPNRIAKWKKNRTVTIDECIVDTIKYLWENGIDTSGSCCGHEKSLPNLVIPDGYNDKEIIRIMGLIKEIDSREWDICQWRITRLIQKDDKIFMEPIGRVYRRNNEKNKKV